MSTKIQINSLEALERLIGNDNKLEIEVRNSIVQKFAEKHLKSLANSPTIHTALNNINDAVTREVSTKLNKEVATFKQDCFGRISDMKLNPDVQREIDNKVKSTSEEQIRLAVHNAVESWKKNNDINARIDKAISYYNEQHIKEEVRNRLDALIKKV